MDTEKPELGGRGPLMAPWKLQNRRWGYRTQISKTARYYTQVNKEAGLANRGRGSLCKRTVFRVHTSRERKLQRTLSAHTVNIYIQTRERLCRLFEHH